jgi:hypothetical protein
VGLNSDNLSDVLDDIFNDNECESDRECKRKRLSGDSEETSDESNDSSNTRNVGATKWAKKDNTPDLGQFTGNVVVKLLWPSKTLGFVLKIIRATVRPVDVKLENS